MRGTDGAWGVSDILYIYETVALESCHLFILLRHRTQFPDMPFPSDTQAFLLIVRIPLIQRRGKCHFRQEKSAFT